MNGWKEDERKVCHRDGGIYAGWGGRDLRAKKTGMTPFRGEGMACSSQEVTLLYICTYCITVHW